MRILVAPDKFKDSLGAAAVAENIAVGLRAVLPNAEITELPIADGGEGTAAVICAAAGGAWRSCATHGPLGEKIAARYCTVDRGRTAIMEMSAAAGLWRVPPEGRDPLRASSFGVGEMLLDASRRRATQITIGLGGSATNDGGFGMARAIGFRFFDRAGAELKGNVGNLLDLARIDAPVGLSLPRVTAAVDVQNPLLGERGATLVFGPQKGASAEQLDLLENALTNLAQVVMGDLGVDFRDRRGAGAAGGLGFGLLSFCSAEMRPGFEIVAEAIGLEAAIRNADVIITGEGRLDAQSLEGKAPGGVAHLARKYQKKIFAIVGCVDRDFDLAGIFDQVFTLAESPLSATAAIQDTPALLKMRAGELAEKLRVLDVF